MRWLPLPFNLTRRETRVPIRPARLLLIASACALTIGAWRAMQTSETGIVMEPVRQSELPPDEDLLGGDDLLGGEADENPWEDADNVDPVQAAAAAAHEALFTNDRFPLATECRTCHPDHYREWSVSQHAYAQLSPIFNAMHAKITELTNGTNGDFCIRCHTPAGMQMGEPVFMSNMDRHPVSREGVTCVVCHRQSQAYGKLSARIGLVEGDIIDPVFGPKGNAELQRVLDDPGRFRVVTRRDEQGRRIHNDAIRFFHIEQPGFCGSCHDVTLVNGFRLEEAFSEYKSSPAADRGATCQDCHMGVEPGIDSGYAHEPAAIVGGIATKPRKRTNHYFAGPDYSVMHPGLFPHNPEAMEFATMEEWTHFDTDAGWGTPAFEDAVPEGTTFPDRWRAPGDREIARRIINDNLELLEWARQQRLAVLRRGYVLGDITIDEKDNGLAFTVDVMNGTDGHNVPTGFTAERLTWLHVVVTDRDGAVVMESGDMDPNGDVRDLHSQYVHDGLLPLDEQLFSLQSKFIVRNRRGGEREQVLAVNHSLDPLPFVRRDPNPTILTGRPIDARIHKKGIAPLDTREAKYRVAASDLTGAGPYTISVELRAAMVPVNLVREIMSMGFDYNMTPREVVDNLLAGHHLLWERTVTVNPDPTDALVDGSE